MKDPELYDFFKKGGETFEEMPSAALWDKIDKSLKQRKKKPLRFPLTIAVVVLAILALTAWVYFAFSFAEVKPVKKIQPTKPANEVEIFKKDSLKKHDTLPISPIENTIQQKKTMVKPKSDLPTEFELSREDNATLKPQANPIVPASKPEITNQPTEEIATTTTFKNRIVVRTAKKLTDAEYELLIESEFKKNKDNYGVMLIIIAPGHPAYRKVIPGNRLDVKTTYRKVGIQDTLFTVTKKVISTNDGYLDTIIKNQQNVEVRPEFPGGVAMFYKYVSRNYHVPETAIDGKTVVSFVVNTNGTLSDFKIIKESGAGTGEEFIRVLKSCTVKWIPGYKDGKPIVTQYTLPIMISSQ